MSRGATAQLALSGVLRGSALYLGGVCAEVLNSSRQRRQKKKNGFQKKKKNKTKPIHYVTEELTRVLLQK